MELKSCGVKHGLEKRMQDAAKEDTKFLPETYKGAGIDALFNIADLRFLAKAHETTLTVRYIIY